VVGGVFATAAGLVFTAATADSPIWQPVLASALMGAGMGLITTPLIVGLQSTVGWGSRGVITGGAMFSRFLGQSLGAAIFGAITNAVLKARLEAAPAALAGQVPTRVDGISELLAGGHPSPPAAAYLQASLQASTHAVFVGLLAAAVATVLILLLVVPRRFPTITDDGTPRSRPYANRASTSAWVGPLHRAFGRGPNAYPTSRRISSGLGASATHTDIASIASRSQTSSTGPKGRSTAVPAAATFAIPGISAWPRPMVRRIDIPSCGWIMAAPCSSAPAVPTTTALP
jgi:hypothetical protein